MTHLEALKAAIEGLPHESSSAHGVLGGVLNASLYEPIEDLLARPSKQLRASLIRAGYLFVRPSGGATLCGLLAEVLESIHAGSLVIDDIQDGSRERRGSLTLHEKYGVPLALNAGNFLYFQPFSWIASLGLPERTELRLYRLCHEAMLNAHMGQAIDLGTDITNVPAEAVEEICLNASRLKTGSLTSLALCLGATLAGADEATLSALKTFGENFGIALQRFDDVGNLALPSQHAKRFEDLSLKRPSWAWALATQCRRYDQFVFAAGLLPDDVMLMSWLERENFFAFAQRENENFLETSLRELRLTGDESRAILETLGEKLKASYGTQVS